MSMNVIFIVSGVCSIDTKAASSGTVGHERFQAVGPVALWDRAIAVNISANDGAAPASGGNVPVPWLVYVP